MADFIIIGAGYGGLASGALLANSGFEVQVLESHVYPGGCASYFKRKEFLFDVGATTFSGVKPDQPLGMLFDELNLKHDLIRIDPGMIIRMDGKELRRFSDQEAWTNETEQIFKIDGIGKFWDKVYKTDSIVWELLKENKLLPPANLRELVTLIKPVNLKGIRILPGLFKSFGSVLSSMQLKTTQKFHRFIDELLLITAQNTALKTPWTLGAMGLAYPAETYYPSGGMFRPAKLLEEKILSSGGAVRYKEKVVSVEQHKDYYFVKTAKGNRYKAKGIISNIPVWNMSAITDGAISNYFEKIAGRTGAAWGAVTLNFAIESAKELESLYFQIHTKEKVPHCHSQSFFVSFSAAADRLKAPAGWRSVTISLHSEAAQWFGLSKPEYERRKSQIKDAILKEFRAAFPEFDGCRIEHVLPGTPVTFQFYTQRHSGFVGGIPHSIENSLLKFPPNKTPFNNFYMAGDTVFPGQGTPAVVLGAIMVWRRVMGEKGFKNIPRIGLRAF